MSAKLPVLSGAKLIKILVRKGFIIRRQSGSHVVMQKDARVFSVPLHDELKRGTLKAILKQAGLEVEDLIDK
jgi:predicted RNA binding protein YcfA (HicA-like mRNA interferase family)